MLIPQAAYSAEADSAEATCDRGEKNHADPMTACRIGWNFPVASSGASFWVQQLGIVNDGVEWSTVGGPFSKRTSSSATEARGGTLYRVVACDASAKEPNADCTSSTVIWAPIIVSSYRDIPQFVELKDGTNVSALASAHPEDDPIEWLIIDYNSALLARLVSFSDVEELPAMTDLSFENVHNLPYGIAKWDGWCDYNMRRAYPVDPIGRHLPTQ
jgi:hypothetical protein